MYKATLKSLCLLDDIKIMRNYLGNIQHIPNTLETIKVFYILGFLGFEYATKIDMCIFFK